MPIRDVRILARTGLTMVADVYDTTDALVESINMVEINTTGIFRANITTHTGHWVHMHDSNGFFADIVRLAPTAGDLRRLGWTKIGNTLIFTNTLAGL